jgi:hypothetical protein
VFGKIVFGSILFEPGVCNFYWYYQKTKYQKNATAILKQYLKSLVGTNNNCYLALSRKNIFFLTRLNKIK